MTRRVLVTGATGFVGRKVVTSLLEKGLEVFPVVRPSSAVKLAGFPNINPPILTEDLFGEDETWWENKFKGIDTVVHVAWYAEPGRYQFSDENFTCLTGTIRMARSAVRAGVKRFVGVGTCFEYAQSDHALSVDCPLAALSPYAACKVAAYFTLSQMLPQHGIEFAWCRLFYLYGDGEDPRRLVPLLRKHLSDGRPVSLTAGSQVRDFLDVAEAGRRIATVASSSQTGPVNICSGKPVTVRQLAESIAEQYGGHHLLRFGVRADNPLDPATVVGVPTRID